MLLTEEILLLKLGFEVPQVWEETQLLRVIDELGELGVRLASQISDKKPRIAISCIKSLGMEAVDRNMTEGVLDAAVSLGLVGQEAARNRDNNLVLESALALRALGMRLVSNDLLIPLLLVAISLKEVGKEAARNRMEKEVILSQDFLKDIHTLFEGSKDNFETLNQEFSFLIRDIGKCCKGAGLEKAAINARVLFDTF